MFKMNSKTFNMHKSLHTHSESSDVQTAAVPGSRPGHVLHLLEKPLSLSSSTKLCLPSKIVGPRRTVSYFTIHTF